MEQKNGRLTQMMQDDTNIVFSVVPELLPKSVMFLKR